MKKTIKTDVKGAGGRSVAVRLDADHLDVLDRFIAAACPGASREEALRMVFEDWAEHHGYLPRHQEGTRPEDLNASNDD